MGLRGEAGGPRGPPGARNPRGAQALALTHSCPFSFLKFTNICFFVKTKYRNTSDKGNFCPHFDIYLGILTEIILCFNPPFSLTNDFVNLTIKYSFIT